MMQGAPVFTLKGYAVASHCILRGAIPQSGFGRVIDAAGVN